VPGVAVPIALLEPGLCFNGKLRVECLNMEVFHHPDHARAVTELWQRYYTRSKQLAID
jgi:hypothetical protein